VAPLAQLLADGTQYAPPKHSLGETIVGLVATGVGVWLFVRALLRGSGPYGRT
jgi:hypothetical protein